MKEIFTADSLNYDHTASVERHGFTFKLSTEHDDSHDAPWNEEDSHGPVSDWRRPGYDGRAPKRSGELVLATDHGSARFYDMQEACKIARRDGWGSLYPYTLKLTKLRNGAWEARAHAFQRDPIIARRRDINRAIREVYAAHRATFPSDRAYAANAARADYERLRTWCNGDWYYMGVVVTVERNGIKLATDSLWGIESDADKSYILEVANDCAATALEEARDTIAALVE